MVIFREKLLDGDIEINLLPSETLTLRKILRVFLFFFCSWIPYFVNFFIYSNELPSNASNSASSILTISLSITYTD